MPHHEIAQGDAEDHGVGHAELVGLSCPAGTATPPETSYQAALSFTSLIEEPTQTGSAEPSEHRPKAQQEPELVSTGRRSLKRKASEELLARA